VRTFGGIGSENADTSSDKQCERHCRRKSKVSCVKLICAGVVDPNQVNIPEPARSDEYRKLFSLIGLTGP